MARSQLDDVEQPETLYCINHPKRETLLRCSRCLQPICTECAVPTPVGMRCPACAKRNRPVLYVVKPKHVAIAIAVALPLSLIGGAVARQLGIWLTVFLSAPIGGIIAEAVLRTAKKHGRIMQVITGVCIVIGALAGPWLLAAARLGGVPLSFYANPLVLLSAVLNVQSLLYTVLAVGAAVARLH